MHTYKALNYETHGRKCRVKAHDMGLGNDFLEITPETQTEKSKVKDYNKLRSSCTAKEIIKKVKRHM